MGAKEPQPPHWPKPNPPPPPPPPRPRRYITIEARDAQGLLCGWLIAIAREFDRLNESMTKAQCEEYAPTAAGISLDGPGASGLASG